MEDMSIVVGVDNGYGLTKTVHTEFVTAVRDYGETKPALPDHVVHYKEKYYIVGGDRKKTRNDKTEDIDTYILTLAGIAEELSRKNLPEEDGVTKANIVLAVGLPLDRCAGNNRDSFKEYFKKEKFVRFEYEDKSYEITIEDVYVNAQCVSGIVDQLSAGLIPDPSIIVDIGSWTIDILPIENGKPQAAKVLSLNEGVIKCMNRCNEEIRRRNMSEVAEFQIQQIMLGNSDALPAKYSNIIQDVIRKYVINVKDLLEEHGYNLETITCVFMGGGVAVVKNYGRDLFPMTTYINDIHANAVGYELIVNNQLKKKG